MKLSRTCWHRQQPAKNSNGSQLTAASDGQIKFATKKLGKNSFIFVAITVAVFVDVVVAAVVVIVVVVVAIVAVVGGGTVAICFFHAGNCISGSKLLR